MITKTTTGDHKFKSNSLDGTSHVSGITGTCILIKLVHNHTCPCLGSAVMTLPTVTESPGRKEAKQLDAAWYIAESGVSSSIPGGQKKTEQSIFLGLCSDQQLSFFTLLDRTSFPHYNNTKIIKFGWKLFLLWVISYGLSFSGFAINFPLVGGPPKNGTVNFLGLCSDEQLFFSPCWIEHFFLIIMTPRSSNLVRKLFILWVISYRLSFLGFAINLSSCLETLDIGQITKMTVHKKCLIK